MAGFGRFWPVFLRIPKTETRSSSRAHPSIPATLCGEHYSNAGLLGCFFPEDSQDRNLVLWTRFHGAGWVVTSFAIARQSP